MEKINHNFKKKFGQNFIVDNNIIDKIISYVDLSENDLVIEIGPGAGVLTKRLSDKSKVLAYEIDKDLEPILAKNLNDNVCVIWDDFLNRNISDDISKYKYNKLYIVANLPYYITTPIVEKIINEKLYVDKIIIMVQKEVGERFSAVPGTKSYGSLTVFLNYYYDISKLFLVNRKVFVPQPNVDSMVIELKKKEDKTEVKNIELFFKLVRDSFKYKRKTLKNNLTNYDLNRINEVLNKYNKDLTVRAEEIPLEIFIEIANNL